MAQPNVDSARAGTSHWILRVVLVGLAYFAVGIVFASLAGAATASTRIAWRLAAWLISAAIFARHVQYEYARLDNPPAKAAWRAALAVALGAFGVAAVAYARSRIVDSSHRPPFLLLAFLSWPILTGVVAFVVAFLAASIARMASDRFR
jgi:hypothetical protein